MSFSWIYLTRRFLFQNYRDMLAVSIVGSYIVGNHFKKIAANEDDKWIQ